MLLFAGMGLILTISLSSERTRVNTIKTFKVFGEPVEVLIPGEMTGGSSITLTQVSPPGGGPPPHSHQNEDETFFVLEGQYEFLWLASGAALRRVVRFRPCAVRSTPSATWAPRPARCWSSCRLRNGKISGRNFRAVHARRFVAASCHLGTLRHLFSAMMVRGCLGHGAPALIKAALAGRIVC